MREKVWKKKNCMKRQMLNTFNTDTRTIFGVRIRANKLMNEMKSR